MFTLLHIDLLLRYSMFSPYGKMEPLDVLMHWPWLSVYADGELQCTEHGVDGTIVVL